VANVFLRVSFPFILTTVFAVATVPDASADDGGLVIARDGKPAGNLVIAKGKPLQVAVLEHGTLSTGRAEWSAVPEGVLNVRDLGDGRAEVTANRDLFDNGGREPRATLRVCVGNSCTASSVACVLDVAGRWQAHIDISGLPVSKDRGLTLRQDGRQITYKDVVIKLEGDTMRLVSGGSKLKRFSGKFTARGYAHGTWISVRGFGGTWSARR
jgi:hypothetical protein